MKFTKIICLLLIISVLPLWSNAQKDDKKKGDKTQVVVPEIEEGIVYFLPRTGISVKVKVNKKKFIPGPYYQWANKFLGYNDAMGSPNEKFDILKIEVKPIGEADPDCVFRTNGTNSSLVSLMNDGVITGINAELNKCGNLIEGNDLINYNELPEIIFPDRSSYDYYDIEVNTATGEETTSYKNDETKAREAADYLYLLRQKRAFISNTTDDDIPKDGEAFSSFLKQSEKLESEYLSLFLGKTFISEQEYSFIFFPGEESVKNEVLFRFSEDRGVLPKTDISGKPIMLEMTKDHKAIAGAKKFDNTVGAVSKSGLYYRIPVYSSLILTDGINQYYSGRILIGQFGAIAAIPESLLEGNFSIVIDHITGNLKGCSKINNINNHE